MIFQYLKIAANTIAGMVVTSFNLLLTKSEILAVNSSYVASTESFNIISSIITAACGLVTAIFTCVYLYHSTKKLRRESKSENKQL